MMADMIVWGQKQLGQENSVCGSSPVGLFDCLSGLESNSTLFFVALSMAHTWDSSRSRSTGESGRGKRRGKRRGEGADSRGVRRGFSVPPSSPRCCRVSLWVRRAAVSSSPGLSRIRDGPGGGGSREVDGRGGGGGGPGAGAALSTGRGGGSGEDVRDRGRGEQVRDIGRGEQVRDGGVGVEGREMDGGGDRLLRRPHCSLLSLLLMTAGTWTTIFK